MSALTTSIFLCYAQVDWRKAGEAWEWPIDRGKRHAMLKTQSRHTFAYSLLASNTPCFKITQETKLC